MCTRLCILRLKMGYFSTLYSGMHMPNFTQKMCGCLIWSIISIHSMFHKYPSSSNCSACICLLQPISENTFLKWTHVLYVLSVRNHRPLTFKRVSTSQPVDVWRKGLPLIISWPSLIYKPWTSIRRVFTPVTKIIHSFARKISVSDWDTCMAMTKTSVPVALTTNCLWSDATAWHTCG